MNIKFQISAYSTLLVANAFITKRKQKKKLYQYISQAVSLNLQKRRISM